MKDIFIFLSLIIPCPDIMIVGETQLMSINVQPNNLINCRPYLFWPVGLFQYNSLYTKPLFDSPFSLYLSHIITFSRMMVKYRHVMIMELLWNMVNLDYVLRDKNYI